MDGVKEKNRPSLSAARGKNKKHKNRRSFVSRTCTPPFVMVGVKEENNPSLNVAWGKSKEQKTKYFLICEAKQKAILWDFASQNPSPKAVFI